MAEYTTDEMGGLGRRKAAVRAAKQKEVSRPLNCHVNSAHAHFNGHKMTCTNLALAHIDPSTDDTHHWKNIGISWL